ncbi:MAG TPA: acetyl-CoA carboxylase biotin carboxyl carrier protein [Longimicrobiales bacterium]|nr:acetyl-CoA carboxylase biotin carboxyl carrier protein [Longimicrobiales bacterium]
MAQSTGKRAGGKSGSAASAAAAEQNGRGDVAENMTDLAFLRGLIDAVDQSGIDSLEINRSGTRIRIAKTPAAAVSPFPSYAQVPVSAPQHAPAAGTHAASAQSAHSGQSAPAAPAAPAEAPAPKSNLVDVKSPMVGTFYRAPAPDAPPYVEQGTTVTKGQTLCILEAMKLMNELECEVEGVIREILVEDTEPVEYGQVLFRVEPAGSK